MNIVVYVNVFPLMLNQIPSRGWTPAFLVNFDSFSQNVVLYPTLNKRRKTDQEVMLQPKCNSIFNFDILSSFNNYSL